MNKYYITTAIDYINGKPHIGHAYEKVAADVLARHYRLRGDNVFFLTGTDEHGAKIARYAQSQDLEPKQLADRLAIQFAEAWDKLQVSYNRFIRTTDEDHIHTVRNIMNLMKDNGYLYQAEYSGLYCVGHEAFITEKDLVNGVCPEHQTAPEMVTETNWFLKISAFKDEIKKRIQSDELLVWPEQRKNEVLAMLEEGFPDVAITRPNVKWGIPVPWSESETVYVWPDALTNYLTGVGYGTDTEQFQEFWPADAHIVGKDIAKFHCIIWPAILLAAGLALPKSVRVHGFFTLNGRKISKSLGNVIDPIEWVDKYGSDAVRYFLMREVSFASDGDVSEEKLRTRYETELANGLGNLVSRVTNMIEKYSDGIIGSTLQPESDLDEVDGLIANFRFHEALARIFESVTWANQYIDENKPWELAKTDLDSVGKILSKLVAQLFVITHKLAPFMPETADKIRLALESERIVKIEPLFPRVE